MSTSTPFEYRAKSPAHLASDGPVVMTDVSAEIGAPNCAVAMRIDTGATLTRISQEIAKKLSLEVLRHDDVVDAGGQPIRCPIYEVQIAIRKPDGRGIIGVFGAQVVGMPEPNVLAPQDGVLGRDFLHNIKVTYDGQAGTFQLVNSIDEARKLQAVEELRQAKRKAQAKRKKDKADVKKGRRKRNAPPK